MRKTRVIADKVRIHSGKDFAPLYANEGSILDITFERRVNDVINSNYGEIISIRCRGSMTIKPIIDDSGGFVVYKNKRGWFKIQNGIRKKLNETEVIGEIL